MLADFRERFAKWHTRLKHGQQRVAQREVMDTLFNDLYSNRKRVYQLNFVRGIFFGLGSVLGGTLVLAMVIWILTWFVDFPLIGQWIEKILNALPSR